MSYNAQNQKRTWQQDKVSKLSLVAATTAAANNNNKNNPSNKDNTTNYQAPQLPSKTMGQQQSLEVKKIVLEQQRLRQEQQQNRSKLVVVDIPNQASSDCPNQQQQQKRCWRGRQGRGGSESTMDESVISESNNIHVRGDSITAATATVATGPLPRLSLKQSNHSNIHNDNSSNGNISQQQQQKLVAKEQQQQVNGKPNDDDGYEYYYLKKRRPNPHRHGMYWQEDPRPNGLWLHNNLHWPRDFATLRGKSVTINNVNGNGHQKWLLCTHVKQYDSNKWHKAPKGAALPFYAPNKSYMLVPLCNHKNQMNSPPHHYLSLKEQQQQQLGNVVVNYYQHPSGLSLLERRRQLWTDSDLLQTITTTLRERQQQQQQCSRSLSLVREEGAYDLRGEAETRHPYPPFDEGE